MSKSIDIITQALQQLDTEIKVFKAREKDYKIWLRKLKEENDRLKEANHTIEQEKNQTLVTICSIKEENDRLKQENNTIEQEESQALSKQIKILLSANKLIDKKRNKEFQELQIKKRELMFALSEMKTAKQSRDKAIGELDRFINQLEDYKRVCRVVRDRIDNNEHDRAVTLLKEADRLLFNDDKNNDYLLLDRENSPQMFTDMASINRSLLEN